MAHDPRLGKDGFFRQPNVAMVQLELVSYPHGNPVANARWGFKIAERVKDQAKQSGYDWIKFGTKADANVLASGTHLNLVLWAELNAYRLSSVGSPA